MSLILDALKRTKPITFPIQPDTARHARTDAHADTVLSTLGYRSARTRRGGLPGRMLVFYSVAAIAIGFVGLSLLIRAVRAARAAHDRCPLSHPPRGRRPSSGSSVTPRRPPVMPEPLASTVEPAPSEAPIEPATTAQLPPLPRAAVPMARRGAFRSGTGACARGALAGPFGDPAACRCNSPTARARRARRRRSLWTNRLWSPPHAAAPPVSTPVAPNHFAQALYYQRVGDFDNALAHYRALLEQNDASAEVHNNLGLLYQDRGQLDDAMRAVPARDRDRSRVREGAQQPRRRAACGSNRPDSAAAEFRVALAAEPRNVESLVNLALVQKAAGRIADARDLLRRALAIDPRNAGSHYNLAVRRRRERRRGDADRALPRVPAVRRRRPTPISSRAVRARLAALGGLDLDVAQSPRAYRRDVRFRHGRSEACRDRRSPSRRPHLLPAAEHFARGRSCRDEQHLRRGRARSRSVLGEVSPASSSGRGRGTRCSTGSRRTRSGSSAAS